MKTKEKEIFKKIEGFPKYEISNLGRVRSTKRKKAIFLKSSNDNYGYLRVILVRDKKPYNHRVHVLIARAFIRDYDITEVVHYKNGITTDLRLENLEICSRRDITGLGKKKTSKYTGVSWHTQKKTKDKWISHIKCGDRVYHLGSFDVELDAHFAYEKARKNYVEKGIIPEPKKMAYYQNQEKEKERK